MRRTYGGRSAVFATVIIYGLIGVQTPGGQSQSSPTGLPSEMPARIDPVTSSFDYVRREVMIPMPGAAPLVGFKGAVFDFLSGTSLRLVAVHCS